MKQTIKDGIDTANRIYSSSLIWWQLPAQLMLIHGWAVWTQTFLLPVVQPQVQLFHHCRRLRTAHPCPPSQHLHLDHQKMHSHRHGLSDLARELYLLSWRQMFQTPLPFPCHPRTANCPHLLEKCLHRKVWDFLETWSVERNQGQEARIQSNYITHLAAERVTEDECLSQLTKEEFGNDFLITFSYIKGGKRVVKVKSSDIAKQYRAIKGMKMDDKEMWEAESIHI